MRFDVLGQRLIRYSDVFPQHVCLSQIYIYRRRSSPIEIGGRHALVIHDLYVVLQDVL